MRAAKMPGVPSGEQVAAVGAGRWLWGRAGAGPGPSIQASVR